MIFLALNIDKFKVGETKLVLLLSERLFIFWLVNVTAWLNPDGFENCQTAGDQNIEK